MQSTIRAQQVQRSLHPSIRQERGQNFTPHPHHARAHNLFTFHQRVKPLCNAQAQSRGVRTYFYALLCLSLPSGKERGLRREKAFQHPSRQNTRTPLHQGPTTTKKKPFTQEASRGPQAHHRNSNIPSRKVQERSTQGRPLHSIPQEMRASNTHRKRQTMLTLQAPCTTILQRNTHHLRPRQARRKAFRGHPHHKILHPPPTNTKTTSNTSPQLRAKNTRPSKHNHNSQNRPRIRTSTQRQGATINSSRINIRKRFPLKPPRTQKIRSPRVTRVPMKFDAK